MEEQSFTCAHCGKLIPTPPPNTGDGGAVYCSFGCEVKGLLAGLGWGARWLGVSLGWGLAVFGLLALLGRAMFGGPIVEPASYVGLVVVLGLMALILSVLRRRVKD
ncbi:MAG: hypothetical protein ACE5G8_05350 [Anaerolineae bacterium]